MITLIGSNGNMELTTYIPVPEYTVNDARQYVEWTDGNYKKHKHLVRQSIYGEFKLKFPTVQLYKDFVQFIEENLDTENRIKVNCYCMNTDKFKTADVFLNFEPQNELPLIGNMEFEGFTVEIEE